MNDLVNYKFITSVALSLLGCGLMQFGFPDVLHHIPENKNFCHRTVESRDRCMCVCVMHMEDTRTAYKIFVQETCKEDQDLHGRIILK